MIDDLRKEVVDDKYKSFNLTVLQKYALLMKRDPNKYIFFEKKILSTVKFSKVKGFGRQKIGRIYFRTKFCPKFNA